MVALNKPPNRPMPFSSALIFKLLIPITAENINMFIEILEYRIALSRLTVTADETNNKINDVINNFQACILVRA